MSPDIERGKRIKLARINRGYERQQDLADKIGYSQEMISFAENGGDFSFDFGIRLMRALDITIEYILGEKAMLYLKKKERLE